MTNKEKFKGYIGTYTKGDSKGIYSFTLDTVIEKIIDVKLVAELENPTYLTISENNKYLYSVMKKEDLGGVAAFSINENGELAYLNHQLSEGSPPCHISVGRENQNVFSAYYHRGMVESHLIQDGFIEPLSSKAEQHGSGPDPRQEKSHAHFIAYTPDEKYVVAINLGSDEIYTYAVTDGMLEEVTRLSVKPGSGPRHLVFHQNQKYVYVMTEFSSEVIVLHYHEEDGSFTEIQTISTIPAEFTENNQGSAIHISSDGRFVYAGNRGHNSIAIFEVNADSGELTFVDRTSTEGDWPRDFALDPSEKFLVASNQESSNLVLFARDLETGKLTLLESNVTVPYPVCVKFLHV